jgi:hypothetical protein
MLHLIHLLLVYFIWSFPIFYFILFGPFLYLFWRHQERNTIGLGFSYGLKKKKGKTTLYDERLIQIIQLFILSCPGFTFFVFLI